MKEKITVTTGRPITIIILFAFLVFSAVFATIFHALGYDNPDKPIIEPIVVIHDDDYTITAVAKTEPYSEAVTTTEHIDRYVPNDVQQAYTRTEIIQIVEMNEPTTEPELQPRYILTDDEKRLISVVAWNADHTDDDSLACVIQTILNRIFESDKFPDTVEEVLRQKKQFESCDKVLSDVEMYDYDYIKGIIDKVCINYNPFEGELVLFYSAKHVNPSRIAKGLYLVKESGGSLFYSQK